VRSVHTDAFVCHIAAQHSISEPNSLCCRQAFVQMMRDFDIVPKRLTTAQLYVCWRSAAIPRLSTNADRSEEDLALTWIEFVDAWMACILQAVQCSCQTVATEAMIFENCYSSEAKHMWTCKYAVRLPCPGVSFQPHSLSEELKAFQLIMRLPLTCNGFSCKSPCAHHILNIYNRKGVSSSATHHAYRE
jgi:hypothetical protein